MTENDKEMEEPDFAYMSEVGIQCANGGAPPRRLSVKEANEEWNELPEGGKRERNISFSEELGDTTATDTGSTDDDLEIKCKT